MNVKRVPTNTLFDVFGTLMLIAGVVVSGFYFLGGGTNFRLIVVGASLAAAGVYLSIQSGNYHPESIRQDANERKHGRLL